MQSAITGPGSGKQLPLSAYCTYTTRPLPFEAPVALSPLVVYPLSLSALSATTPPAAVRGTEVEEIIEFTEEEKE